MVAHGMACFGSGRVVTIDLLGHLMVLLRVLESAPDKSSRHHL